MSDAKFELITANKVTVDLRDSGKGVIVDLMINDRLSHSFDSDSRISMNMVSQESHDHLVKRFTDGQFFFVEDQLIDFRDSNYNGFVQSQNSIEHLMRVIGAPKSNSLGTRGRNKLQTRERALEKEWGRREFDLKHFQNSDNSMLAVMKFGWNPFHKNVGGSIMLVRALCGNESLCLHPTLGSVKVPLVNRWDEHLDIAQDQVLTRITKSIEHRMVNMAVERATVGACNKVEKHLHKRMDVALASGNGVDMDRLRNMLRIVNPNEHLEMYYTQKALEDNHICDLIPSHLTKHDMWNIVTEANTHTESAADSTVFALDRLANEMMFTDTVDSNNFVTQAKRTRVSHESCHNRAFFGM